MRKETVAIVILAIGIIAALAIYSYQLYSANQYLSGQPYIVSRTFNYSYTFGGGSYESYRLANGTLITENTTVYEATMILTPITNATRVNDPWNSPVSKPLVMPFEPYPRVEANCYRYYFNQTEFIHPIDALIVCINVPPSTESCNGSYPGITSSGTVQLQYYSNATSITLLRLNANSTLIEAINVTLPP